MKVSKLVAAAALLVGAHSYAAYNAYVFPNGGNVRAVGSGTVNTSGLLASFSLGAVTATASPNSGWLLVGGGTGTVFGYTNITGPTNFGAGSNLYADASSSGQMAGVHAALNGVLVPSTYVSGSPLVGTADWSGQTLATMGLNTGTYSWVWGAGPTADIYTLKIMSSAPVTATKTVSGPFTVGSAITYTVVLTNNSSFTQPDNPGNEYLDVLPAGVTLVSAAATTGTAVANVGTNTVSWNGSIASGASITLTINATVNASAAGTTVSSQGTVAFDADGNGDNETTGLSDDPGVAGAADATRFTVPGFTTSVPTLSQWGLIIMASLMTLMGLARAGRRR